MERESLVSWVGKTISVTLNVEHDYEDGSTDFLEETVVFLDIVGGLLFCEDEEGNPQVFNMNFVIGWAEASEEEEEIPKEEPVKTKKNPARKLIL